jgi:hypothetical protein
MLEKSLIERFTDIYAMKKILIFCCLAASLNCIAQDKEQKRSDPSNWFTGGSISLGYSGGYYSSFLAGLHPHYGYTIAKWIDAAAVVNFEYQSQKDLYYNYKQHNTTYGLGAFTRIYPVHFLFIQAEPEYNFINVKTTDQYGNTSRANLHAPSLLLGGGYTTSRSGKNSFSYLSVLVDVIKNINSPYVDANGSLVPIIRAGINIGLNRKRR